MKMNTWNGTEWFGVEWGHVPYWEANECHSAYGVYKDGIELEIGKPFEYVCVYFAGEFMCSFELDRVPTENSVLTLKGLTLIKDHKLITENSA